MHGRTADECPLCQKVMTVKNVIVMADKIRLVCTTCFCLGVANCYMCKNKAPPAPQTYRHTYIQTYIQTSRQTGRETGRQADRLTDRHTDRGVGGVC